MAAAAENAPCCMLHSHSLYPQFLELSENAPRCCLLHANPAYLQCPEEGGAAASRCLKVDQDRGLVGARSKL